MKIQLPRILILSFTFLPVLMLASPIVVAEGSMAENIAAGKKLAFERKKGNCLACHVISDGVSPGTVGPPLISMKVRFPDKAKLKAQIWDATAQNPVSIMPPFGLHKIMTEKEIDLVVEYIHSL